MTGGPNSDASGPAAAMAWKHWLTLGTIAILVTGVVGFQVHVGMGAFAAAAILTLAKVTDEKPAILAIPWGVIVMVCGVTVLTSLLEKTGGIDLFTTILARFATHRSVTGLIALCDRSHIGLQQHIRRGVAGSPAERTGPGCQAGRWKPAGDCVVDFDRRPLG